MKLSSDLVSRFAKMTNDKSDKKNESMVYATVRDDGKSITIDGSNTVIPIAEVDLASTTKYGAKDRVTVMIKNHTAIITGNLSDPSARSTKTVDVEKLNEQKKRIDDMNLEVATLKSGVAEIDEALINKLDVSVAKATYATIDSLKVTNQKVANLEAKDAEIENLKADKATVNELSTKVGEIDNLKATKASVDDLSTRIAEIDDLKADKASISDLEADVAKIDTLIYGSASGDVIQTDFANAVIAQLGDAKIKSAMIDTISADKIAAGTIKTNNVTIVSGDEDGLRITKNLIQFYEGEDVRIQIGKDDSGAYSVLICDDNGNVLLNTNGITKDAIPDQLIVNDMVSDTANIHADKLDIDSLFSVINDDTNTKTIKSTKIVVDDKGQTLSAALDTLATTDDVDNLTQQINSQSTTITAMQGEIATKVTQQDITTAINDLEPNITSLSTQYSEIKQTVDGLSTTVSSHTSEISKKAEEVETAQTTANDAVIAASTAETLIKQLTDSISMLVTDGNGTSLMTQTEDGWTFSTASIQGLVNKISEDLNSLTEIVGSTDDAVGVLKQSVDDLGEIAGYVKIGTYENEPCIELGEGNSEFKLRITNTRMAFTEGSNVLAYFNNQSLHIKKAVVEDELQQGGFVWKVRSNGNMGLTWKGGNS